MSKSPRSAAQTAASRANGARSLGPITDPGKCKISKNRMSHGFRSGAITLNNEDRQAYDEHLDAYLRRYQPVDKVEEDLVGLLASSMWHIMRNNSVELALLELEISGIDEDLHGRFEAMDQYGRLALAFKKSAGDNALELLRRYKTTSERAYHRALQALESMRKDRPSEPLANAAENLSAVQTQDDADPPQTGLLLVPDRSSEASLDDYRPGTGVQDAPSTLPEQCVQKTAGHVEVLAKMLNPKPLSR